MEAPINSLQRHKGREKKMIAARVGRGDTSIALCFFSFRHHPARPRDPISIVTEEKLDRP
jgi:hypothetical protein